SRGTEELLQRFNGRLLHSSLIELQPHFEEQRERNGSLRSEKQGLGLLAPVRALWGYAGHLVSRSPGKALMRRSRLLGFASKLLDGARRGRLQISARKTPVLY